jgi:predicted DNA-binding protein with PD1-like motif
MKYSQAKQGRIFVIRLEHNEIVHETIESFAREHNVTRAALIILGGADTHSRLVVGPEDGDAVPAIPMTKELLGANEITGTGTIFPDESGHPILHMHIACGRKDETTVGCIRTGVRVWHVMEAILFELVDNDAMRKIEEIGFKLLCP